MIPESDLCVSHAAAIAADPVVQRWQRVFAPLATLAGLDRPGGAAIPARNRTRAAPICRSCCLRSTRSCQASPGCAPICWSIPCWCWPWGFARWWTPPRRMASTWRAQCRGALVAPAATNHQCHSVGGGAGAHRAHPAVAGPGLGHHGRRRCHAIYAYVRENNPKETIAHRFVPTRRVRGDRDCRVGVKTQSNQRGSGRKKSYFWGYASGFASTPTVVGDVVLADITQTGNHQDITVFRPAADRHVRHPRRGADQSHSGCRLRCLAAL